MFTGLIESVGTIAAVDPAGDGVRVRIDAPRVLADAAPGDSISVSGVCLTVADVSEAAFTADVMQQTLRMSSLAGASPGTPVNLERAVTAGTRLGGHVVQGHVDGTGRVLSVAPGDQWTVVRMSLPDDLAPLVAPQGSITVDGVSLTVSGVSAPNEHDAWFEVSLIPETLRATTLGALGAGDAVNIETDILARHVARLLAFGPSDRSTSTKDTQ